MTQMTDTETIETQGDETVSQSQPMGPRYILDTKGDYRRLGLYVAILYMIAAIPALAVHESGHIFAHWCMGVRVCGLYLSPAFGKTFAFYPRDLSIAEGFESLAGIAFTQVLAYTLYALLRKRQRTTWFLCESLLSVFVIALLVSDTVYMPMGLLLHFGDPYEAARNFGVSSGVLWALAVPQVYVAKYIGDRVGIRWFRANFDSRVPRGGGIVMSWVFLSLLGLCLIYAAYAACFM